MRIQPSKNHEAARGFTLIETMMAAALGALLALACMAMFGAMDRTETATARRFSETASMARLHLVMNRVFGNLLIQNVDGGPSTSATTRTSGQTSGRSTATSGSDFKAADNARNGQAQIPPRPRVLLEQDTGSLIKAAMKTAGLDSAGATPQRLEVVTLHAPIPANYANASEAQLRDALDQAGVMAARGVFELRPDGVTPKERMDPGETLSGDGKGWTLWWRPLPPTEGVLQPDPFTLDPTQDPSAVRVATGLVECSWQVFKTVMDTATNKPKGREKVPELNATQLQDLPAYVEMRATTASGLSANWMFEVGWGYGPETTDEAEQSGSLTASAPGNAATNGNPQFAGGPGGRGGPGRPGGAQGITTAVGVDGTVMTVGPGKGGRGPGTAFQNPAGPGGKPGAGGRKGN